mmetsp:Transcript_35649/g.34683  ORF Transcript_35649/g.34683 Transcript_35649/m.34683 type:complete len:82 (+) Transcript_35649:1772-2017(+)
MAFITVRTQNSFGLINVKKQRVEVIKSVGQAFDNGYQMMVLHENEGKGIQFVFLEGDHSDKKVKKDNKSYSIRMIECSPQQ